MIIAGVIAGLRIVVPRVELSRTSKESFEALIFAITASNLGDQSHEPPEHNIDSSSKQCELISLSQSGHLNEPFNR